MAAGTGAPAKAGAACAAPDERLVAPLVAADLLARLAGGGVAVTAAGRAHVARLNARASAGRDPFLAQHLDLAERAVATPDGYANVLVDEAESPLAWLARRKGRDGRALIEPSQLQAGERLRGQFTRAQMTPRVTASWDAAVAQGRRGGDADRAGAFAETTLAARQQVRNALDAVGPEFAGLLVDVCCFLKRLEDVERERGWPARSAKVVLQLALDRLARHYGLAAQARGRARAEMRTWLAPDAAFSVGE